MNLKHLTDKCLIEDTKNLIQKEREIVHRILEHLKEIEKRRLFSSLGYQSLFEYAVRGLGYSEAQAHTRISSMRLTKELPEVLQKLESGKLSLTNVAKVASFFKQQKRHCKESYESPLNQIEKREIINKIENKSKRQTEKLLFEISPSTIQKAEYKKVIGQNMNRLQITVDDETLKLIEVAKGKWIHKHGVLSTAEVIKLSLQQNLSQPHFARSKCKKLNIGETARKSIEKVTGKSIEKVTGKSIEKVTGKSIGKVIGGVIEKIDTRNEAKDNCENCGSHFAVEVDHIIPKALGGNSQPENLRLLCRNCNQRAAIEKIGNHVIRHWS